MRCETEYGAMRDGACCDGRRSAVCEMGERRGALGRTGWSVMGAVADDSGCGAWGKEKAQAMGLGLMVDGVSGSAGLIDAEGFDGLLCFLVGEEDHVRGERDPHQIVKPFGLYGQHLMVSTHEILHSYASVGIDTQCG